MPRCPLPRFHRIKCFCEVDKNNVQILIFLLGTSCVYLSGSEDHVGSISTGAETSLAFWEDLVQQLLSRPV